MVGTAATSLTGTTLATIPAAPSGTRLLTRPSSSSAPTGAVTPDSQLDRTSQCGACRKRSKSCTVSGPSSSLMEENSKAFACGRATQRFDPEQRTVLHKYPSQPFRENARFCRDDGHSLGWARSSCSELAGVA